MAQNGVFMALALVASVKNTLMLAVLGGVL